ncbi:hypothetical protein [Planktothricoides raciborskii]|uniref:hypothetical protein n=1 Tax=Planktothricoides raciborskii TaxID=132608 RepID=UPI001F54C8FE|nr:hypothetical protein [Planktothricoides raciborskii]
MTIPSGTLRERAVYIAALEDAVSEAIAPANRGDLSSLINLFAKSQKQAFLRSLGLSEQVLSETRRAQVILAAIADKLQQNQLASVQEKCQKSESFAAILFDIASQRFQEIADDIKLSVQNLLSDAAVFTIAAPVGDRRSHYHRYQVVETAKQLGYFANLRNYHTWIQLVINIETSVTVLLSFHVLGHEYRGLLICNACAYHRDNGEEGEPTISDLQPLTDSPFQFSYADESENLIPRFQKWLEDVIVTGLEYWNKSI